MNPNQLPEDQRQRCEVWTRVMGYHRPEIGRAHV